MAKGHASQFAFISNCGAHAYAMDWNNSNCDFQGMGYSSRCWRHILSWLKLWPKAKRHSLRSFQTVVLMPMPWIETTQTVTSKVWAIVHVVDATFWVGSNYGQRPSATVCVHFKLWCSCLCHGLKQLKLWLPRYGLYFTLLTPHFELAQTMAKGHASQFAFISNCGAHAYAMDWNNSNCDFQGMGYSSRCWRHILRCERHSLRSTFQTVMFQVTNRHKSNCGVSRVVHVLQSMAKKLGSHFALEISFQTVI